jgi:hypothetical protein
LLETKAVPPAPAEGSQTKEDTAVKQEAEPQASTPAATEEAIIKEEEGLKPATPAAAETPAPAKAATQGDTVYSWVIGAGVVVILGIIGLINDDSSSSSSSGLSFSEIDICKAAISADFAAPFSSISGTNRGGYVYVSYTSDGSYWDYECMTKGDTAIWRAINGRWRDNYEWDNRLVASSKNGRLAITRIFPDGSRSQKLF